MRSYFTVQPALLGKLTLGFVLATIVGTLSHEAGHWAVAKYYGFDASIHYGSTRYERLSPEYGRAMDTMQALHRKYASTAQKMDLPVSLDSLDFPEKPQYKRIQARLKQMTFQVMLGGPVQTMLTGSLGVFLLATNRRWWAYKQTLSWPVWLVVFTALFWLRQLGNLATSVAGYLQRGHLSAGRGDESNLSLALHLWQPTILLVTGTLAVGVLVYVTRWVIPPVQRFTFLLAGLVGGSFGYWFWLNWVGPKLLS